MRMVVVALMIACSTPARAPQTSTSTTWVFVGGQGSGELAMTTAPDGAIVTSYVRTAAGRGSKITIRQRLATDGSLETFAATGQHAAGAPIDETFTREGGVARWRSAAESGERAVTGPAMFLPIVTAPHVMGYLVRAALANGGKLPLLPIGLARVAKVAEHAMTVGGETKWLACYATTGIDFVPLYTWMEGTTWFGTVQTSGAFVPRGWEAAVAPLLAKQNAFEHARVNELAKRHAHRPVPAGLAYTHARVFDAVNRAWLVDHTVIVIGDIIMAVGPSATTVLPSGAEVVDLAGKALLPGLIDMHAHLHRPGGILYIASGVTTVRDLGNDEATLDRLKKRIDAGTAIGPHVVRWGRIEGGRASAIQTKVRASTPDAARAAVELFAKRGYEGIKIYTGVNASLVPVITKHAHDRNLRVTGPVPAFMRAGDVIDAGFDGIEHIEMVFLDFLATKGPDARDVTRLTLVGERGATVDLASDRVRDFIATLTMHDVAIDPTYVALEQTFTGTPGTIAPGQRDAVGRLPAMVQRRHTRGRIPVPDGKRGTYLASWERMLQMGKLLHDRGVGVVIGSDSTAGLMLHRELELFAQAGFANAAILEIATLGNARALKLDAKIGSITVGKRADLVVIDGDPIADIKTIRNVVSTMRAGVVFPSRPLYESVGVQP